MYIPSLAFVEGETRKIIYAIWASDSFLQFPVTKHNIHTVNTIVSYVCVFYTMLGGIQAVVWTDVCFNGPLLFKIPIDLTKILYILKVLQAIVMISSVVIVALFGISDVGGLAIVWDRAVNGGLF